VRENEQQAEELWASAAALEAAEAAAEAAAETTEATSEEARLHLEHQEQVGERIGGLYDTARSQAEDAERRLHDALQSLQSVRRSMGRASIRHGDVLATRETKHKTQLEELEVAPSLAAFMRSTLGRDTSPSMLLGFVQSVAGGIKTVLFVRASRWLLLEGYSSGTWTRHFFEHVANYPHCEIGQVMYRSTRSVLL
jgi:hypothetical protein